MTSCSRDYQPRGETGAARKRSRERESDRQPGRCSLAESHPTSMSAVQKYCRAVGDASGHWYGWGQTCSTASSAVFPCGRSRRRVPVNISRTNPHGRRVAFEFVVAIGFENVRRNPSTHGWCSCAGAGRHKGSAGMYRIPGRRKAPYSRGGVPRGTGFQPVEPMAAGQRPGIER